MLRMPSFAVATPRTTAEAIEALRDPDARIIAGGTDILPNLKHRLDRPSLLVSLDRVAELRHVAVDGDALLIGASVKLSEVNCHPDIATHAPSLARAAGMVASPSIRNMATIGGNIHLDTRCRYVNQSEFWRSAIGGCLKSEGDVCHVVPGGRNCVAAMSADCVPVLNTLDAELVLVGSEGERRVAIADYYGNDGIAHIAKAQGELMTQVRIPMAPGPRLASYAKWTVRKNIDFPLVSVALCFDLAPSSNPSSDLSNDHRRDHSSDHSGSHILAAAAVCVGVLNARPRRIKGLEQLAGQSLAAPHVVAKICDLVYRQSKPLDNVPYERDYRRKMLPVYTRRAIEKLLRSTADTAAL